MGDHPKRILTITTANLVKKGETKGRKWKIFELFALDEEGNPVPEDYRLRSFWEPKGDFLGKPQTFEVEHQENKKFGDSYLVHRPAGYKSEDDVPRDLEDEVDILTEQIRALIVRVEALEGRTQTTALAEPAAPPAPPPAPATPEATPAEAPAQPAQPPPNAAKRQSPGGGGEFADDDVPF